MVSFMQDFVQPLLKVIVMLIVNRPGVAGAVLQTPSSLIANLQISPDFQAHQKKKSGWLYIWVVVVVVCSRRLGTRTNMSETEVE